MNFTPVKLYIVCALLFAGSLLLWVSGLDKTLTLWLAAHDIQRVNSMWRLVSWFGLGRTQWIFCLLAVAYFIHKNAVGRYPHTVFRVFVGTFYIWLRGLFFQFKPVQRGRFYWEQQAKYVQQLPLHIRAIAYGIPIMFWAGTVCALLKIFIGRPRPKVMLWRDDTFSSFGPTLDGTFHSLPSGHATTTFALLAVLLAAFPKYRAWFWGLAILSGWSRVASVTPHYLGDVWAGAALGFAVGLYFTRKYHFIK